MTEEQFKQQKCQFNYKGVLVIPIIGGYFVHEALKIKASNKQEVDKIIDNGCKTIENSIKIAGTLIGS